MAFNILFINLLALKVNYLRWKCKAIVWNGPIMSVAISVRVKVTRQSPTNQLAVIQVVVWITRGLVNSLKHLKWLFTPNFASNILASWLVCDCPVCEFSRVTVQFRCATSDLMLIQQNKFCWISDRCEVAHLNWTVTLSSSRVYQSATGLTTSGFVGKLSSKHVSQFI